MPGSPLASADMTRKGCGLHSCTLVKALTLQWAPSEAIRQEGVVHLLPRRWESARLVISLTPSCEGGGVLPNNRVTISPPPGPL